MRDEAVRRCAQLLRRWVRTGDREVMLEQLRLVRAWGVTVAEVRAAL